MSTVSLESDLPLVLSIEAAQAIQPSWFPQSTADPDFLIQMRTSNSPNSRRYVAILLLFP